MASRRRAVLDVSRVKVTLAAARKHAAEVGLSENLESQLDFLGAFGGPQRATRCTLFPDAAPFSFTFLMEIRGPDERWRPWFEGGLIYHGEHDGGGCGCGPAFAVTMEPTHGWVVHT
jgi:hypothetical protein